MCEPNRDLRATVVKTILMRLPCIRHARRKKRATHRAGYVPKALRAAIVVAGSDNRAACRHLLIRDTRSEAHAKLYHFRRVVHDQIPNGGRLIQRHKRLYQTAAGQRALAHHADDGVVGAVIIPA